MGKKNPRHFKNVRTPIASTIEPKSIVAPGLQPGKVIEVREQGSMLVDSVGGGKVNLLGRDGSQIVSVAGYSLGDLTHDEGLYSFNEDPTQIRLTRDDAQYHAFQRKLKSASV